VPDGKWPDRARRKTLDRVALALWICATWFEAVAQIAPILNIASPQLAKVSPDTVARFERGEDLKERTIEAIRTALEKAGNEAAITPRTRLV
jgi:hypothetical protein